MIALRENRPAEAKTHFARPACATALPARCYVEYAKLETDNAKATTALLKAAGINPKSSMAFALLAARRVIPVQKRLAHWKLAAERCPRNPAYWQHLAEAYAPITTTMAPPRRGYLASSPPRARSTPTACTPRVWPSSRASRCRRSPRSAARPAGEARDIARLKVKRSVTLEQEYSDGKSAEDLKTMHLVDDPKTPQGRRHAQSGGCLAGVASTTDHCHRRSRSRGLSMRPRSSPSPARAT